MTQTSVYPREVVKEALARNSAAVLLVHTYPSGTVQPSRADEALTQTLTSNGGRAPRTSANVWYRQPPSLGGPNLTGSTQSEAVIHRRCVWPERGYRRRSSVMTASAPKADIACSHRCGPLRATLVRIERRPMTSSDKTPRASK